MSALTQKILIFVIILGVLFGGFASQTTPPTQAQDNEFGAEWFGDGVLYEVFVRSFRDSDGDGIGDLQGVIAGLDHIQSVGANIIWLMPIHPSPSYHGYDVMDYYAINPDYGTLEDMQALIDAVHERGMYIIIDYVANHSSNQHPFFLDAYGNPDSEYTNFYSWLDEGHTEYRTFYGVQEMPELNYGYPPTREYMVDVATYWLDPNGDGDPADGVDGLRCDVAIGPPISFWREVRTAMREVNPDSLLLAEAWLRSGTELQPFLLGDAFNAAFDFPAMHALVNDHNRNGDGPVSGGGSIQFAEVALKGSTLLFPDGAHLIRFISNHDTNRFMSEVEGDWKRAKAGAIWLYTAPGTPMIYYGEEIGMFGTKGTSGFYDEYRREPLDWYLRSRGEGMPTWFRYGARNNLPRDGISVEEEQGDPNSLLTLYQELGAFRQATPALRGAIDVLDFSASGANLYGIVRGDTNGEYVLVFINFTTATVTATLDPESLVLADVTSLNTAFSSGFLAEGLDVTSEPAGYAILTN